MRHLLSLLAPADTDRRGFIAWIGRAAAALSALGLATGCDAEAGGGDDRLSHGPVRTPTRLLRRPSCEAGLRLLAPYDDGRLFAERWAVAHAVRGPRDQLVIVLVDVRSGGFAELQLYASSPRISALAESVMYGVYLDDGEQGDAPTPPHMELLALEVADVVAANEGSVTLGWTVPTLVDAPPRTSPYLDAGEATTLDA